MEKELLNQFKTKDFWWILGFTIIDGEIIFFRSLFSFLPKKHKVKLQRYRIRYEYFDEWYYSNVWENWNYRWQFKEKIDEIK